MYIYLIPYISNTRGFIIIIIIITIIMYCIAIIRYFIAMIVIKYLIVIMIMIMIMIMICSTSHLSFPGTSHGVPATPWMIITKVL